MNINGRPESFPSQFREDFNINSLNLRYLKLEIEREK